MFKKAALIGIVLGFISLTLLGILYVRSYVVLTVEGRTGESSVSDGEQSSVFAEMSAPIYAAPVYLEIESVKMHAEIANVGIEENGFLGVPPKWDLLGWYDASSKPGEDGNMIIDGHYDDNFGRPAAFWGLKNVNEGDRVTVQDALGRIYFYRVVNTVYLDTKDPDRLSVLNTEGDVPSLTLITCGGVWNPIERTYSKRLVLKAALMDSSI